MEKLHVLLSLPLQETDIQRVEAVDPRVEVRYVMEETRAEQGIPRDLTPSLTQATRQKDITPEEAGKALDGMLARAEVIFAWYKLPRNILSRAPHLKWVQSSAVGIDTLVAGTGLLESKVVITNASGINTNAVAEAALGFMLMIVKKAPRLVTNKLNHRWEPLLFSELKGKTLGIVGLGRIGAELARMAKALNMQVLASTRPEDNTSGADRIFSPAELHQMLPECDFVVVTVPLIPATRGLIGAAEFKAMKPGAYFINVSRGQVVREKELIEALKEKRIAGAALDVFETEPLPPDSELWDLPDVIISPHTAGYLEQHMSVATGLFCENLKRYLAGEDLLNVFNKARGY